MTAENLLINLVKISPAFRVWWRSTDNYFIGNDGSFTLHGVFMELAAYFRVNGSGLEATELAAIGAFLSECMEGGDEDLDNAASTCFLESIAGDPSARLIEPFLRGEALAYLVSFR